MEHAPYDRIIVTAEAWDIPPAWTGQLTRAGGWLSRCGCAASRDRWPSGANTGTW